MFIFFRNKIKNGYKLIFSLFLILFFIIIFSLVKVNEVKHEKTIVPIINENINSFQNTDSLDLYATNEWHLGNYQKALEFINSAYVIAKNENDEKSLSKILNTLGLINWSLTNYEDALTSFKESAKLAEKYELSRTLGHTHINRALIFRTQKNYELAFYHNTKAIMIFEGTNSFRDLGIAFNNQGQIFKHQHINDSAKVYYQQALSTYEKVDYKDGAAASYYNLSEIYMREGLQEEAIAMARKSLDLGLEIESKVRVQEAYLRLSETYANFHQMDSAYEYYKIYTTHYVNFLKANQTKKLAENQAKMGAELKSLQIENLEKERELATNKLWFIGIWIFILLLIISIIVYRFFIKIRYKKRKLELDLDNSKRILLVKEQELKVYMLEMIKKNAFITKLQKKYLNEDLVKDKSSKLKELLEQKILTEEDWETFKTKFKIIYPEFFSKLKFLTPTLTEAEVRLLVLLRLNLTGKEQAKILCISDQSVRAGKMRLKRKLTKEGYGNIDDFLQILID